MPAVTTAHRRSVSPAGLAALVALATAVLLAVAALGVTARPGISVHRHTGAVPHAGLDLALAIITVLFAFFLGNRVRRMPRGHRRNVYTTTIALMVIVPAVLALLLYKIDIKVDLRPYNLGNPTKSARPGGPGQPPKPPPQHGGTTFSVPVEAQYAILALAATAIAVAAGWYLLTRRPGHAAALAVGAAPDDEARQVIDAARTTLSVTSDDPRGQVIEAYAALEAALARRGTAREAHAAPEEWLEALARARPAVLAPARSLTAIFERARFSATTITVDDARAAARFLDGVRDGLSGHAETGVDR